MQSGAANTPNPSTVHTLGSIARRSATFVRVFARGERRVSREPSVLTRTSLSRFVPDSMEPTQFFVSIANRPNGVMARWFISAVGNAVPGA